MISKIRNLIKPAGDSVMPESVSSLLSVDLTDTDNHIVMTIPDMPSGMERGEINLIRAVYDRAQNVIEKIDGELERLEKKKEQLLVNRQAHEELFIVASKFVDKIDLT